MKSLRILNIALRAVGVLGLACVLAVSTGCNGAPKISEWPTPADWLHNLKPHRLAHLNRGSPPARHPLDED
jgi:hypothetical protein